MKKIWKLITGNVIRDIAEKKSVLAYFYSLFLNHFRIHFLVSCIFIYLYYEKSVLFIFITLSQSHCSTFFQLQACSKSRLFFRSSPSPFFHLCIVIVVTVSKRRTPIPSFFFVSRHSVTLQAGTKQCHFFFFFWFLGITGKGIR